MYARHSETTIKNLAQYYPIVAITGPRQSGKTTLTKKIFPEKKYCSLEDLDLRQYAQEDPKGFLNQTPDGLIIDEVQQVPELFSYLQGIVDRNKIMGQYVITGSQQFGMMGKITQSLAGRVGHLELLPFSIEEVIDKNQNIELEQFIYRGLYPPVIDRNIPANIWYGDYIRTYLERDVRQLINIKDLSQFQKFLSLCAARTGQLLNYTELGNALGIEARTIKSWLSILEASYIIFLLKPHHKNFSKKLIKSPKIYFYDTGLLCYLLKLRTEDLMFSPFKGHLFESLMISNFIKHHFNYRSAHEFYFWRDHKGMEIDLLIESHSKLIAVEFKSGTTLTQHYFDHLKKYREYAGEDVKKSFLIYGGGEQSQRSNINTLPWTDATEEALKQ